MPYGQDDNTNMAAALASIRQAFGGGAPAQPQVEEEAMRPNPQEEALRQAKMQALQKMSSANRGIDPEKAAAFMQGFQR